MVEFSTQQQVDDFNRGFSYGETAQRTGKQVYMTQWAKSPEELAGYRAGFSATKDVLARGQALSEYYASLKQPQYVNESGQGVSYDPSKANKQPVPLSKDASYVSGGTVMNPATSTLDQVRPSSYGASMVQAINNPSRYVPQNPTPMTVDENTSQVIKENFPKFYSAYSGFATLSSTTTPSTTLGIGGFGINQKFSGELSKGIVISPVEKPVTTGVSFAIGGAFPIASEFAGAIVGTKAVRYGTAAVGGLYAGYSGYRIGESAYTSGIGEAGRTTGSIIGSEIIPGGLGYASFEKAGIYKTTLPAIATLNKNYVPFEQTGVKVVEGTTIPTSRSNLLNLQGTKIDTVHVTASNKLDFGTKLSAQPKMATGWRKSVGQFNFYQSVPSEGKPTLYGGYAGIGEGYSGEQQLKFSLLPSETKAFIFRGQEISTTPRSITSSGLKSTIKFQTEVPGTYIAGENIFGLSKEGQVTTSVGKVGKPLFSIEKNPSGELYNKFTYYEGSKIFFKESKLNPLSSGEYKPSKTLDINEYAKSFSIKTISPSSIIKSPFSITSFGSTNRSYSTPKVSSYINTSYSSPSSFSSVYSGIPQYTSSIPSYKFSSSYGSIGSFSSGYYSSSLSSSSFKFPSTPNFGFPSGEFNSRKPVKYFKGKRRPKYTPDYRSLVFNIRGKAPKVGKLTGYGEARRPIPKGYSFAYGKIKFGKFKF